MARPWLLYGTPMDLLSPPFLLTAAVAGPALAALALRLVCRALERRRFRACERALADEELLLRLLLRRGPEAAPGTREAFVTALRTAGRHTRALHGARREAAERRQAELMHLASAPPGAVAPGP